MRISDWSSDVCSSDLLLLVSALVAQEAGRALGHRLAQMAVAQRLPVLEGEQRGVRNDLFEFAEPARSDRAADPKQQRALFSVRDAPGDRKSVVEGKSVSVRCSLGGGRQHKKKRHKNKHR